MCGSSAELNLASKEDREQEEQSRDYGRVKGGVEKRFGEQTEVV
jgi:hypothetical protein